MERAAVLALAAASVLVLLTAAAFAAVLPGYWVVGPAVHATQLLVGSNGTHVCVIPISLASMRALPLSCTAAPYTVVDAVVAESTGGSASVVLLLRGPDGGSYVASSSASGWRVFRVSSAPPTQLLWVPPLPYYYPPGYSGSGPLVLVAVNGSGGLPALYEVDASSGEVLASTNLSSLYVYLPGGRAPLRAVLEAVNITPSRWVVGVGPIYEVTGKPTFAVLFAGRSAAAILLLDAQTLAPIPSTLTVVNLTSIAGNVVAAEPLAIRDSYGFGTAEYAALLVVSSSSYGYSAELLVVNQSTPVSGAPATGVPVKGAGSPLSIAASWVIGGYSVGVPVEFNSTSRLLVWADHSRFVVPLVGAVASSRVTWLLPSVPQASTPVVPPLPLPLAPWSVASAYSVAANAVLLAGYNASNATTTIVVVKPPIQPAPSPLYQPSSQAYQLAIAAAATAPLPPLSQLSLPTLLSPQAPRTGGPSRIVVLPPPSTTAPVVAAAAPLAALLLAVLPAVILAAYGALRGSRAALLAAAGVAAAALLVYLAGL